MMRKQTMKKLFQLVVILLVLALMVVCADSGDGTGGGQGEALALLSTSVVDGAIDVPLEMQIVLGFSKNVIAISVREQNSQCFTLSKDQGEPINLEVIMADDQLEPEKKREIILKPSKPLEPGTVYHLMISEAMTSKSGTRLEGDILLSFTTIKTEAKALSSNAVVAPTKTTTQEPPIGSVTEVGMTEIQTTTFVEVPTTTVTLTEMTTQIALTEAVSESVSLQSEVGMETPGTDQLPILMGLSLAMILLAGLGAGYYFMKKRNGNGKAGRS